MPSPAPQRRLAAILAADMVGYSRLIERDEAGTVARLKADREEFIDPTIVAHGGRVVRLAGDGALVEFPSVVEATQCAIDIQRGMPKRNAGRGEDEPIVFRIGVNLGDIIVEDDNLHGEGINIAARLESLADPGGVLVSEEVARHVEGKIDAPLEFAEERTVKNIERPVRIWRILLKPGASSVWKASPPPPRRLRLRWISASLGLGLAATIGGLVWHQPWTPDGEPAPVEEMALSLPDRPSIAVLPFSNMSGDPEQEYFSDGITEDLTTDLSKISGLFVVARNSSFAYKGKSPDVREVSRDLGVKYVLEGSVRRAGDQIRINAQLIDAITGGHVWGERFDGTMADVFSLQDHVNRKIVSALEVNLSAEEERRLEKVETSNPDAYDLLLRGIEQYNLFSRESTLLARDLFKQAALVDPNYARAYANIALTYATEVNFFWTTNRELSIQSGLKYAEKALELDDSIPQIYMTRSILYLSQRRFDAAIEAALRTIEVHPNYADGHASLAFILSYSGQLDRALEAIRRARQINPQGTGVYLAVEGRILFLLGRYQEALTVLEESVERNPGFDRPQLHLAAVYAQLDRIDDAAWAVEEALAISPDITLEKERRENIYKKEKDLAHYLGALRKAGMPE